MKIPKYPRNRPTRALLPHQKPILKYMMGTDTPALFIDMRLGKTILTIEYAVRTGCRNVLVIAPKSALNSWEKELIVEGISCVKLDKSKTKDMMSKVLSSAWVLTNPQKLSTWSLNKRRWDLVVVDESSRIKNARSKYFKVLMTQFSRVRRKLLLSGTPTPESILEAVPQLLFLHGSVLGCKSYWEFLSKYTIKYGYDRFLYKSAREKLMDLLHTTSYFLSQKKAGIAQKRRNIKVSIPKTQQQMSLFKQIKSDFEMDINGQHYETDYALTTLVWSCKVAGGLVDGEIVSTYKYEALRNVIKKSKGPVVVWFRFNEELHYCKENLEKDGYKVAEFYGEMSIEERKAVEKDFQSGLYDVILLQVKTGLYALDLSISDTAVYYSNSWSLEERLQSEKRISHPKKTSKLTYVDLVTKGWPDTTLYNALKKKNVSAKLIWEARNDI